MCTVLQCAQEIMGGEEVEIAREDNLNSRESCCKRGPGSGVVGRWGYWIKKVVFFLKRGTSTVCLSVDDHAPLGGEKRD